jgi:hypothetical protein
MERILFCYTKGDRWRKVNCWILTIKEEGFNMSLEKAPVIPSCLWLLQQGSPSYGVAQKVLKPRYSNSPDRPGIFTNKSNI